LHSPVHSLKMFPGAYLCNKEIIESAIVSGDLHSSETIIYVCVLLSYSGAVRRYVREKRGAARVKPDCAIYSGYWSSPPSPVLSKRYCDAKMISKMNLTHDSGSQRRSTEPNIWRVSGWIVVHSHGRSCFWWVLRYEKTRAGAKEWFSSRGF
jgi:hypothetical protein